MPKASSFSLLSLFLWILFSWPQDAEAEGAVCSLKANREYVSLSAPVTHLLEEFGLLNDSSLKAVSIFHTSQETGAKKLAGGIFLSPKVLEKHRQAVVFYDESRELGRSLAQNKIKRAVEVKTRGMDPFEANRSALEALTPYLKACGKKIEKLMNELETLKKELKQSKYGKRAVLFYLGKLKKNQRPPELIISNDGFVKFLKENGLKTYPGELPYLSWSQRILKGLERPVFVGVEEARGDFSIVKVKENAYNLSAQGALSPGLKQARFLSRLAKTDFLKKLTAQEASAGAQ